MSLDFEHYAKTGQRRAKHPNKRAGGAVSRNQSNYPDHVVLDAVQRAANGEDITKIAKDIGCTKCCVSYWVAGIRRTDVTGGSLYDKMAAKIKAKEATSISPGKYDGNTTPPC